VSTTAPLITTVVPFYRQPKMLQKQIDTWYDYSAEVADAFKWIVVDDCSPEPAEDVVPRNMGYELYRIDKDVAWNRGMARNLGTKMAMTPWVLHVDTDHILPAESAAKLVACAAMLNPDRWYRFYRFRVGAADATRKKDPIPDAITFGKIHPHIDSYLCTPEAFWKAGGYNEDFSGILGGGTPFLKEMVRANDEPAMIEFPLHVHTRHSVPDSSEHTLPRDPEAFKRRKREIMAKRGTLRGHDPIRLPWHKVF
jgi:hypothetical protein